MTDCPLGVLGRDQEAQYCAAVRLRNDSEHRFHSLGILHRAYTCQGIFSQGPRQRWPKWGSIASSRLCVTSGRLLRNTLLTKRNPFSHVFASLATRGEIGTGNA